MKEKFGTCRVYTHGLGIGSFHQVIYPGYVYNQFPQWLWKLDFAVFHKVLQFKPIYWLTLKYQAWIYNRAYKKGVAKYPHLRTEILVNADHLELLKWAKDILDGHWEKVSDDGSRVSQQGDTASLNLKFKKEKK